MPTKRDPVPLSALFSRSSLLCPYLGAFAVVFRRFFEPLASLTWYPHCIPVFPFPLPRLLTFTLVRLAPLRFTLNSAWSPGFLPFYAFAAFCPARFRARFTDLSATSPTDDVWVLVKEPSAVNQFSAPRFFITLPPSPPRVVFARFTPAPRLRLISTPVRHFSPTKSFRLHLLVPTGCFSPTEISPQSPLPFSLPPRFMP